MIWILLTANVSTTVQELSTGPWDMSFGTGVFGELKRSNPSPF